MPASHDWESIAASPLLRHSGLGDVLARYRGTLVYLATPYTRLARREDGAFCAVRSDGLAHEASCWAAMFALNGVTAISPIVCAVAAVNADLARALDPLDARFWENWCRPLLRASDVVVIPPLPGWKESAGVFHEAREAVQQMKPVQIITPGEWGDF